jgi:hypothetical protein
VSAGAVESIEDLINAAESIQSDLMALTDRIWEHVPELSLCEKPCDDAHGGMNSLVDYLEDQKKAFVEEAS